MCRLDYLGIDNIHVVREAFVALRAAVVEESARSLHSAADDLHVRMPVVPFAAPLAFRYYWLQALPLLLLHVAVTTTHWFHAL
jgi:hypothetical protein